MTMKLAAFALLSGIHTARTTAPYHAVWHSTVELSVGSFGHWVIWPRGQLVTGDQMIESFGHR